METLQQPNNEINNLLAARHEYEREIQERPYYPDNTKRPNWDGLPEYARLQRVKLMTKELGLKEGR